MLGVEYLWLESLAPNDEDIKDYRKSGDRQTFRRRYLATLARRNAVVGLDRALFDGDVVLLCSEADARRRNTEFVSRGAVVGFPKLTRVPPRCYTDCRVALLERVSVRKHARNPFAATF